MRRWIIFSLFIPTLVYATYYKLENCNQEFLTSHYLQLTLDERAIAEAYNKIVTLSGTTRLDHCVVEFPFDGVQPVDGIRRVMLDTSWYRIIKVNGTEIREKEHHGLIIEYERIGTQRKVISLIICRTPESCKREGIPYRFLSKR